MVLFLGLYNAAVCPIVFALLCSHDMTGADRQTDVLVAVLHLSLYRYNCAYKQPSINELWTPWTMTYESQLWIHWTMTYESKLWIPWTITYESQLWIPWSMTYESQLWIFELWHMNLNYKYIALWTTNLDYESLVVTAETDKQNRIN